MSFTSKTARLTFAALTAGLLQTQGGEEPILGPLTDSQPPPQDFLQLFGSQRLRYEFADGESLESSELASLRTRFGLKTRPLGGFGFLVEGEHLWVLTDTDDYQAFPGFPPVGQTPITDPDNFQLNRLQFSYQSEELGTTLTAGRQTIVRADQRFIGAVGWRQNDQTFDAVSLENKSWENLSVSYAYLTQVNRIFGTNAPLSSLESWDSDSHLLDLVWSGFENHTARAFAYVLDFDNSPANSVNTFGLELKGSRNLCGSDRLGYLFTGALQEDGGQNPLDYREYYLRGEVAFTRSPAEIGAGMEIMTSDGDGGRFLFPLGTNHKFNGYADAFLTTPADGLMDAYAWIGTEALGCKHTATVHYYQTEEDHTDLGWEVDYVASRPLCEQADILLKGAFLQGSGPQQDLVRASLEINFIF